MGKFDEDEAPLPFPFQQCSNGEYVPPPMTAMQREAQRRANVMADDAARRLGMSRRKFLTTASGAAVSLMALAACANEEKSATTGKSTTTGGTFGLPPESTTDTAAASTVLDGSEFIMDVQTHLLDYDLGTPVEKDGLAFVGQAFPQRNCGEEDWRACFSIDHYIEEFFLKSDTSFVVLSQIPIPGPRNPFNIDVMDETTRVIKSLCENDRVRAHGQGQPNFPGGLDASLDAIRKMGEDHDIAAWKTYTHLGTPFFFDDDMGMAYIELVKEIGPPIICTHKGFAGVGGGSPEHAAPRDIGPAAKANPDVSFVIYHSGYDVNDPAGPYSADDAEVGVNRLIKTLEDNEIGPNGNVYAELGSTWYSVMGNPERAAHTIGKLLKHVGEDRVVWGTDCIWYGTPQPMIDAFRAFQISPEFQETYGYPELTDEIKRKVFGINSAKLYGVDPTHVKCEFTRDELRNIREELALPRSYGPTTHAEVLEMARQHGALV